MGCGIRVRERGRVGAREVAHVDRVEAAREPSGQAPAHERVDELGGSEPKIPRAEREARTQNHHRNALLARAERALVCRALGPHVRHVEFVQLERGTLGERLPWSIRAQRADRGGARSEDDPAHADRARGVEQVLGTERVDLEQTPAIARRGGHQSRRVHDRVDTVERALE